MQTTKAKCDEACTSLQFHVQRVRSSAGIFTTRIPERAGARMAVSFAASDDIVRSWEHPLDSYFVDLVQKIHQVSESLWIVSASC
jgi:hypothetical protein